MEQKTDEAKKREKQVGIWNMGVTCYLSSGLCLSIKRANLSSDTGLRCLLCCRYVFEITTREKIVSLRALQTDCLYRRFLELAMESLDQVQPLDPVFLKKKFTMVKRQLMPGYGQQDAFEFLLHLLDAIDDQISMLVLSNCKMPSCQNVRNSSSRSRGREFGERIHGRIHMHTVMPGMSPESAEII